MIIKKIKSVIRFLKLVKAKDVLVGSIAELHLELVSKNKFVDKSGIYGGIYKEKDHYVAYDSRAHEVFLEAFSSYLDAICWLMGMELEEIYGG